MRSVRRLPEQVTKFKDYLKSGAVTIDTAAIQAPTTKLRAVSLESLLDDIAISAKVSEIDFEPPESTRLPPVDDLTVQLKYTRRVLTASQGSAKLGTSKVSDINGELDL